MSTRCPWVGELPIYIDYHDKEWGKPQFDSQKLFEKICLEGQQAGLSWITVLKKREAYRAAFHQFDPAKIEQMTEQDIDRCMENTGLIRHRAKTGSHCEKCQSLSSHGKCGENFSDFVWSVCESSTDY